MLDKLVDAKKLVAYSVMDEAEHPDFSEKPSFVLEHPRISFISYPYEWCFHALRDAAILQLDVYLEALRHNVMLEDATAYNVQFVRSRPIFIDHLSFRPYREGEVWASHQQFCNQFLNPLLLRSLRGVAHNAWYKGCLEGISTVELNQLVPLHKKLSWNALIHLVLQARFLEASGRQSARRAQRVKFNKNKLVYILSGIKKWITKLQPMRVKNSTWHSYTGHHSYRQREKQLKQSLVADFMRKHKPRRLLDLGCNTGDYSVLSLNNGAEFSVGVDFDCMAVEQAYLQAKKANLNFLPLCMDMVNPTPGLGWDEAERKGFKERAHADAVLALALLHHLVIGKNVPLESSIAFITDLAPAGIIEFVPKTDPMVQELLLLREDIFQDYTEEAFSFHLQKRAKITAGSRVSESGRMLYQYAR